MFRGGRWTRKRRHVWATQERDRSHLTPSQWLCGGGHRILFVTVRSLTFVLLDEHAGLARPDHQTGGTRRLKSHTSAGTHLITVQVPWTVGLPVFKPSRTPEVAVSETVGEVKKLEAAIEAKSLHEALRIARARNNAEWVEDVIDKETAQKKVRSIPGRSVKACGSLHRCPRTRCSSHRVGDREETQDLHRHHPFPPILKGWRVG